MNIVNRNSVYEWFTSHGEGDPWVICCQGPPRCSLQGDEAIAAQEAGCPWCKRIVCHPDGTETVMQPATA